MGPYQFGIAPDHLPGTLVPSGQYQRPSAADAAVPVHELPVHACPVKYRSDSFGDNGCQLGHAAGIIQDFLLSRSWFCRRWGCGGAFGQTVSGKIAVICGSGGCFQTPKAALDVAGVDTDGAYRHALAAHQAFVRALLAAGPVATAQQTVEIHRGIAQVLLLPHHRTCVNAHSAVGA